MKSPEGNISPEESRDYLNYRQKWEEMAAANQAVDDAVRAAWARGMEQGSAEMIALIKPLSDKARQAEKEFDDAREKWLINPRYAEHPISGKDDTELSK